MWRRVKVGIPYSKVQDICEDLKLIRRSLSGKT